MSIGEKIRELRVAKLMTQAELAGTQITRNMLSCIENGSANPSLSTVLYIAGRLNVPAGFLLAEGDDDRIWRKMNRIDSIRRVGVGIVFFKENSGVCQPELVNRLLYISDHKAVLPFCSQSGENGILDFV